MATIKDVAQLANVSVSTVSKYINGGNVRGANAQAIAEAIETLGFRANPFARNLKNQRNRSIGVLLPDMSVPFFGNVLNALERTVREHGYHVLISCYGSNHGRERDNLRFLLTNGIDGLIYFPEDVTATEFYELSSNFCTPVVQVDRCIQGLASDTVLVNNTEAAYMAVSQLISRGHRRVGLISGPKTVLTAKERQVGYLRALSDHGIPYDDALMVLGENVFATGYLGFESLMSLQEPPTAIFTTNYNLTMGLVTAAREQGIRIPEELDIFGFDCADICSMMKPPLPVVHQPEQEMGRLAATYLIERLEGYDGEPRATELKCRLLPTKMYKNA